MNELSDNLFYSPSEHILFYIAGYIDNSSKVGEIISTLNTSAKKLANLIGEKKENICTVVVEKSRRYKNMRVFFIKTRIVPVKHGAFVISEKTTMLEYLND